MHLSRWLCLGPSDRVVLISIGGVNLIIESIRKNLFLKYSQNEE